MKPQSNDQLFTRESGLRHLHKEGRNTQETRYIFLHPTGKSIDTPQSVQAIPSTHSTRFLINSVDEIRVIQFDEVVCCTAESNYTTIHLKDGSKVMACKTLKEVESLMTLPQFFRIHASSLINLNYIKRILKSNQYKVELTNHFLLDISRSRRDEFLEKMLRL